MKRKLLTLVLSLAMAVTMMPFIASADDVQQIKEASQLETLFATGGEGVLANDVVLDDELSLYGDKIVGLELNGHKLTAANDERVFNVYKGTLTVKDSSKKQTGKVVGNDAENGGIAYVHHNGEMTVVGGTYTGGYAQKEGGAFYVSGKLTVGDGVVLTKNFAYQNGGAIANKGELNVLKATFKNNEAHGNGGAIYTARRSSLTLNSTSVLANKAEEAGAVYVDFNSDVEFNGVTFTANTAAVKAGAVSVKDMVDLAGKVYIYGNFVGKAKDDVFFYESGALTLTEDFDNTSKVGFATPYNGGLYDVRPVVLIDQPLTNYSKVFVSDIPEVGVVVNNENTQIALVNQLVIDKEAAWIALDKTAVTPEVKGALYLKYIDNQTTVAGVKKALPIALALAGGDRTVKTTEFVAAMVKNEIEHEIIPAVIGAVNETKSKIENAIGVAYGATMEAVHKAEIATGNALHLASEAVKAAYNSTLMGIQAAAQKSAQIATQITETVTGAAMTLASTALQNVVDAVAAAGNMAKTVATKSGVAIYTGIKDVVQVQLNFLQGLFGGLH